LRVNAENATDDRYFQAQANPIGKMEVFMRPIIALIAVLGILAGSAAVQAKGGGGGAVVVRGYTKSNGTYVAPHVRTAPDSTPANNWSTKPNVNPITGKEGTKQPARP
jgi:hypothetical protein